MNYLKLLIDCIGFQNEFGLDNKSKNIDGIYGSEETQKIARESTNDEWLLHATLWDVESVTNRIKRNNSDLNIIFGMGGHHVWLSIDNERVFMFHILNGKVQIQVDAYHKLSQVK